MTLTTADDVANMLRWGAAERAKYVAQVPMYIAAASEIIEAEAGPFEARTVTHYADGGPSIALPHRPSSITQVQVSSSTGYGWVGGVYVPLDGWNDFTGWTADAVAAIVYGPFPTGRQNVRIEYTVGSAVIPDSVKLAATMVAVDMWAIASQRAPGLDDQVDPAYLMPKTVRNLLAPFKTLPGFA